MHKNGAPSEIIVLDICCQGHLPEQQSEGCSVFIHIYPQVVTE